MLRRLSRKVIITLLLIWVAGFCGWRLFAQQTGGLTPPPRPQAPKVEKTASTAGTAGDAPAFTAGERLSYSVSWSNFVTAARLELEVIERGAFFGQEGFQLHAKVETTGDVRAIFFEMYNQYTSYANAKTLLPYRLENTLRQGAKQTDETVILDHSNREARFQNDSSLPLPPNTYDPISLLYALRQQSLSEGWKQNYNVIYGKQIFEVEAEVKKREPVISQAGSYKAVRVEVTPKEKQYSKYRTRIWFSDDAQRLPIGFAAQLPFGEVRAQLANATLAARGAQTRIQTAPLTEALEGGQTAPPTNGHGNKPGNEARILPFDLGERLNYEIAWGNFTSVGRASFEVRQKGFLGERRVFQFAAEATSVGAARAVITINDQLTSYADADTLEPLKTDTRLREGRRVKQVTAEYDWTKKLVKLPNGTETKVQPGTLDMVSLFYAIRAAELKLGSAYKFAFLDANHRVYQVAVRANKTETIGGPLGARDCLQLDVLTPDKAQLIAQAWVSNDARRLPLYLVMRMRFGELRFQLVSLVNPR
jgi:hypothetical protein